MDLRTTASQLCTTTPTAFVATRADLARRARGEGDRALAGAIGALPKPTLAAWAVNLLARDRPDDVARLLAIGAHLRAAQSAGSAEDVRPLAREAHDALGEARRQAEELARQAGQALSEPMAQRVQATLHAGMADAWAAQAVRSGLLVADLAATGLGPVDLGGALAVVDAAAPPVEPVPPGTPGHIPGTEPTPPAPHPSAPRPAAPPTRASRAGRAVRAAPPGRESGRRAAEEARLSALRTAAEAEAAVETARSRLEEADGAVTDLERAAADRDAEIASLTARLRELREAQVAAVVLERRARHARDQAARTLVAARKAAERARAAVPEPPD